MSDPLRKNFSDKIEEKVTPESQKSEFQKAKEYVTDGADNLAKNLSTKEDKGVAQQAADVGHDAKTDVHNADQSILEQGKATLGNLGEQFGELQKNLGTQAKDALDQAGKYVNQASEYIQGQSSAETPAKK